VYPAMGIFQISLQSLSIIMPRYSIDPDRRRLLQLEEKPSQRINIHMV